MTAFEKLEQIVNILKKIPDCMPVSVGGSVRDAIMSSSADRLAFLTELSKSGKDFDLEIFGAWPNQVCEALSHSGVQIDLVGRSFSVYKVKGYNIDISFPRKENKTGVLHTDFQVTVDPFMTFKEAALRRSLTINAIGYDWVNNVILDPYDGVKHIQGKILTPVSDKFKEDALRVMRIFKFIGRFGFKPSISAVSYSIGMVDELSFYAKERILGEWNDFILHGKPENVFQAFQFLRETGVLVKMYPEFFNTIGTEQDSIHHPEGSVYNHSLYCLTYFMKNIRPILSDDRERLILGYAVLTHDLGKTTETKVEAGKIKAHGHEDSLLPRKFMERLFDIADSIINEAEVLVKAHMRPVLLHKDKAGFSAIRRLNVTVNGRIDRLLYLVECDQGGRPPKTVNREAIDWVMQKVNEIKLDVKSEIKPIILGRHIITHLKLNPSPAFKPILDAMFEAQLDGKFTNETTGIEYLKLLNKNENTNNTNQIN